MGWDKREPVTNLAILGDEEGNKKKVGGLLIGIPRDKGYDKANYEIVQQDGEVIVLSGSASLARQISEADVGHFIKCEFTGWGKSPNGKFKAIDVFVYDGEPTDVMKKWPRYAEFQKNGNGKLPVAKTHDAKANSAVDEDFPGALADNEDDLPF